MTQGKLAESGTHTELLAQGGLYASLWRKQEGIHTNSDGSSADISVERLKQFPILSHLDDAMLRELSLSQFASENVPAGRDVVGEGDSGDKFYIIARGRVTILKRDRAGVSQPVSILDQGDNFGELSLLRDTPRNATVRTLVPCLFLTLRRIHFQLLLDRAPAVRAAILAQEAARSASPYPGFTSLPFT
jgi:ATP-binding cassette subfamily B protein